MDWPAHSPDLDPIENIWCHLRNCINSRQPVPSTKDEVKQAVVEEWEKITVEEICKYVDSMSK